MKSFRVVFLICVSLAGLLFAQSPDPFQPDIPAPLVAKVNDAKEKQVGSKDLSPAEAELQDVLKQRPDYYRALFNLGLIYQAQGKTNQALQTLENAKKLRDSLHISDSSILNSIGWAYMNSGKLDKAENSFLEALKEGNEDKPIDTELLLNNLGYLYLQKGDTAKSRFYLQRAISEYNSTGAGKVLKMVDEYEQRTWVFRDSSSRYLTVSDLANLSADDLWRARNEIFARNGYKFSTPRGRAFAASLGSYYSAADDNEDRVFKKMNPYERANVLLIKSVERSH